MGDFDPSSTLGPNDPLRAWLQDPSMAEFVKQKAVEHAGNVLGFSDPYGNNIDPNSGMPTQDTGAPVRSAEAEKIPLPKPYPSNIPKDTFRIDSGKPPSEEPYPTQNPLDPTPIAPTAVPLPTPRPAEAGPGASDLSAKKKGGDLEGATNDFAKTLAGVKALQPPPVSPVGTPAPPHHGQIQAAQVNQLLQLMGAQSRPDPLQTLGRLLVSGKA